MGNEIKRAESIQTLVDEVAQAAWETSEPVLPEESLSTPDVEDQVLNRPPTSLQLLRERKEIITGVCVVVGAVTGTMLVSALVGTHYNSVVGMFIDTSAGGAAVGTYVGIKVAGFLNRS